jgi:hypothetical protein
LPPSKIIDRKGKSMARQNEKENRKSRSGYCKRNRTGEDIEMLNERYSDPESGSYGSTRYKDHIDGA